MVFKRLLPLGFLGVVLLLVSYEIFPIHETVLYEKDSAYNHIMVTEDDKGLRYLMFEKNGALQSVVKVDDPDHLELPYVRAVMVGLAFMDTPKRALVVGLGGGTIPRFLRMHFPAMAIDVVDIDPDVVAVAKKFFGFTEDQLLKSYVEDGRTFIERCQKPYDIIFLDAFGSENIPYHLATREFLQAVRRAVTARGVVVGNVWSRFSNPLYDAMVRTYQAVFDELAVFDVRSSGNKILIALPRPAMPDSAALILKARKVSRDAEFPYDLGDVVTYGFRRATHERFDADILTDAAKPKEKAGEVKPGAVSPGG